jgi:hypothetical protein
MANYVGPLYWIIYDLVVRAMRLGWSARVEPWGASIYTPNGRPVHLRATIDGIQVSTDSHHGHWKLVGELRWDPTARSIMSSDGDGIDLVAEHVLRVAA